LAHDGTGRSFRRGLAAAAGTVLATAQELAEALPGPAHVLAGLELVDPASGQRVALDLAVITRTAMFVGVDGQREDAQVVTPRAAARLLADRVQRGIAQPVPVYAFWLGSAAPENRADGSPGLPDAEEICRYIRQAGAGEALLSADQVSSLAEQLLCQDAGRQARRRSPASHLRHAVRGLVDLPRRIDAGLQERIRQPFPFRRPGPILPADVNRCLEKAMLARENVLEGSDYARIVPNDYVVELNENNYGRHYEPIEQEVCARWEARLLETLHTTNNRWGRKAYRFDGRVRIRIRPVSDLAEGEVRVRCQVLPDAGTMLAAPTNVCLELVPGGRRWPLQEGTVTLGRDESCAIHLDAPAVQSARLVSGQHAYVAHGEGGYTLFDGAPGGPPSMNGTFVNGQRVGAGGHKLDDGDVITLASPDPNPVRPGAATLRFHTGRARGQ
jgi:hypothetical protein